MQRAISYLIAGLSVALVLAACDTTDKTASVDDAVRLLQDLEDNDLRQAVLDGADALSEHASYQAQLIFVPQGSPSQVELNFRMDAAEAMNVEVRQDTGTTTYYLPAPNASTATDRPVIRLDNGGIACLATGPEARWLHDGLHSALDEAISPIASAPLLAVIDTPQDNHSLTLLERQARRYDIEASVDEALAIARESSGVAAQQVSIPVEDIALDGSLVRDEDTAALLQLSVAARYPGVDEPIRIEFIVTEWGDVAIVVPSFDIEALSVCP